LQGSNIKYQRFDYFDRKHKNILIAEDNEGDLEIFKDNCEDSDYPCTLFSVWDGEDAIKFLSDQQTPNPDIIILDINMPLMNGHETLKLIKSNDQLNHIPVIMLTSSSASVDINMAKKNGANGYLVKNSSFNIVELLGVIDVVKDSPDIFLEFSDSD
jgi:CheY-like chemotaxis protein